MDGSPWSSRHAQDSSVVAMFCLAVISLCMIPPVTKDIESFCPRHHSTWEYDKEHLFVRSAISDIVSLVISVIAQRRFFLVILLVIHLSDPVLAFTWFHLRNLSYNLGNIHEFHSHPPSIVSPFNNYVPLVSSTRFIGSMLFDHFEFEIFHHKELVGSYTFTGLLLCWQLSESQ